MFKPVLFTGHLHSKHQAVMERESAHTTYPDWLVDLWEELPKRSKTGAHGHSETQSGWHMSGVVSLWRKRLDC